MIALVVTPKFGVSLAVLMTAVVNACLECGSTANGN